MKTYNDEQVWKAIRGYFAPANEAYVLPGGEMMPIGMSDEELDEMRRDFFEFLDDEIVGESKPMKN